MHSLRLATKKCAWRDCLARSRLTGLRLSASFANANLHPRLRPQLVRARTQDKSSSCGVLVTHNFHFILFSKNLGDTWLEHVTPTMSMWCATNCANRPYTLLNCLHQPQKTSFFVRYATPLLERYLIFLVGRVPIALENCYSNTTRTSYHKN